MPPWHPHALHISTLTTMGRFWCGVFVTLASSAALRGSTNPIALVQYVPSHCPLSPNRIGSRAHALTRFILTNPSSRPSNLTTTSLPTIVPLSSSFPVPDSNLILDCYPQVPQTYSPIQVAQVLNRAFDSIRLVLTHGDRLVGRYFEVNKGSLQLLVTTPGDQSRLPSSRLYYSELEKLLGGFSLVLNTQGWKRTKCDYRRERPPDPWLGVIKLDNVA